MRKYLLVVFALFSVLTVSAQERPELKPLSERQIERADAEGMNPLANKKNMWGFANEKGHFFIKPLFVEVNPFDRGYAFVAFGSVEVKRWTLVSRNGIYATASSFDESSSFDGNGFAFVKDCGLIGIIGLDNPGAFKVACKYRDSRQLDGYRLLKSDREQKILIYDKKDGSIRYASKTLPLVIDEKGRQGVLSTADFSNILPFEYDSVTFVQDTTLFGLSKEGKQGVAAFDGSFILPVEYESVELASNKLHYVVRKAGLYGVSGLDGASIFEPFSDKPLELDTELRIVDCCGETFLADYKGKTLLKDYDDELWSKLCNDPGKYIEFKLYPDSMKGHFEEAADKLIESGDAQFYYDNERLCAYLSSMTLVPTLFWDKGVVNAGFTDIKGRTIIFGAYDDVRAFCGGYAAVARRVGENSMRWGFIDRTGRQTCRCNYDYVADFSENMALVGIGTYPDMKLGYINAKGDLLIPCMYPAAPEAMNAPAFPYNSFHGGIAYIWSENGLASIDKSGTRLTDYSYTSDYLASLQVAELVDSTAMAVPDPAGLRGVWKLSGESEEGTVDAVISIEDNCARILKRDESIVEPLRAVLTAPEAEIKLEPGAIVIGGVRFKVREDGLFASPDAKRVVYRSQISVL